MRIETQATFADVSPEYSAFVEKFKPKKTTDVVKWKLSPRERSIQDRLEAMP